MQGHRRQIVFKVGLDTVAIGACTNDEIPMLVKGAFRDKAATNNMLLGQVLSGEDDSTIDTRLVCQYNGGVPIKLR